MRIKQREAERFVDWLQRIEKEADAAEHRFVEMQGSARFWLIVTAAIAAAEFAIIMAGNGWL